MIGSIKEQIDSGPLYVSKPGEGALPSALAEKLHQVVGGYIPDTQDLKILCAPSKNRKLDKNIEWERTLSRLDSYQRGQIRNSIRIAMNSLKESLGREPSVGDLRRTDTFLLSRAGMLDWRAYFLKTTFGKEVNSQGRLDL